MKAALWTAFAVICVMFCSCEKLRVLQDMLNALTGDEARDKSETPVLSGDFFVSPKHSPLWFEFVEGGVRQISGPENAGLYDWTPWPFVPSVTAFMPHEGGLVMVVNRMGFYELKIEAQNEPVIAVYSAKNTGVFTDWTVSTPFYFENRPAVLLENVDLGAKKNSPRRTPEKAQKSHAWSFISGKKPAASVDVPAFRAVLSGTAASESPPALPFAIDREIKFFFADTARYFYFFTAENGKDAPILHFFRAGSPEFATSIEELKPEVFYAAAEPEQREAAPPALKHALELAALNIDSQTGRSIVANVFSPRFGGAARFFAHNGGNGGNGGKDTDFLTGFYTEAPYALLCGDGGSLYEYPATGLPERLPALPEGFVWTGAGVLNGVIAASWEERSSWQTGAAGIAFVVY